MEKEYELGDNVLLDMVWWASYCVNLVIEFVKTTVRMWTA